MERVHVFGKLAAVPEKRSQHPSSLLLVRWLVSWSYEEHQAIHFDDDFFGIDGQNY